MKNKTEINIGDISNTGGQILVGNFENVVANLNKSGQDKLATSLENLKESITTSSHLSINQKKECLEIVSQIGEEATKEHPNKTLLKSLGSGLMTVLKTAPDVIKVAASLVPLLNK